MDWQDGQYGLFFYYAGSEDCRPAHAWGGMRDHWLFHLVHRGLGSVSIAGRSRQLGAGQGFVAPPDTEIHYRADSATPWAYSWLACAGPAAAACFAACGLGPGRSYYQSRDPAFHGPGGRFSAIIARLASCQDDFLRIAGLYEAFAGLRLALAAPGEDQAPQPPKRPSDIYWEAVQTFIRTHYSREDTRIETLAERIGVSRKYLSEIVRQRCGKSPRALLSEYRLSRARVLLSDTALSIGAIAASVGFNDQLAFSRAFHQAWGMSPSAWRGSGQDLPGTQPRGVIQTRISPAPRLPQE